MSDAVYVLLGSDPLAAVAAAILRANLAAAVLIPLVALARIPARQRLGPTAAYDLWLLPLVLTAGFVVFRHFQTIGDMRPPLAHPAQLELLMSLWGVGAVVMAAVFALAHARFGAEVRKGRAGPAVVGLISPRIIMPADDGRYTPEERELIRAHEREHVSRKDPRAAALAAFCQCLCWFNPFVHLAAHLIRLDQELACDAAVVRSRPTSRGLYARTLLKAQLAGHALPFGCYLAQHPLELRVAMLKRRPGERVRAPSSNGAVIVIAAGEAIRP